MPDDRISSDPGAEENAMTIRPIPRPTWLFDLAAFLAVLVAAIILISAARADPLIVRAVADAAGTYLGWQIFTERRRLSGDAGPTPG
jgi:hypothetical protein